MTDPSDSYLENVKYSPMSIAPETFAQIIATVPRFARLFQYLNKQSLPPVTEAVACSYDKFLCKSILSVKEFIDNIIFNVIGIKMGINESVIPDQILPTEFASLARLCQMLIEHLFVQYKGIIKHEMELNLKRSVCQRVSTAEKEYSRIDISSIFTTVNYIQTKIKEEPIYALIYSIDYIKNYTSMSAIDKCIRDICMADIIKALDFSC